MKIYTKTGDRGETGLFGGPRVLKNHARVEAYGTLDEANATLGVALSHLEDPQVADVVERVQMMLFELGTMLATPVDVMPRAVTRTIDAGEVRQLEEWIDAAEAELPELRSFILPAGTPAAVYLHLARTVVRRAERRTVGLVEAGEVDGSALQYLNRLSDLLFVLARLVNRRSGVGDRIWPGHVGATPPDGGA